MSRPSSISALEPRQQTGSATHTTTAGAYTHHLSRQQTGTAISPIHRKSLATAIAGTPANVHFTAHVARTRTRQHASTRPRMSSRSTRIAQPCAGPLALPEREALPPQSVHTHTTSVGAHTPPQSVRAHTTSVGACTHHLSRCGSAATAVGANMRVVYTLCKSRTNDVEYLRHRLACGAAVRHRPLPRCRQCNPSLAPPLHPQWAIVSMGDLSWLQAAQSPPLPPPSL